MYSMGSCAVLGRSNQDALSEDLETDPFLNSALQRFTCELYYWFGSFLAPLRVLDRLRADITYPKRMLWTIKMEVQQVTTNNWKNVEVGRKLAKYNK